MKVNINFVQSKGSNAKLDQNLEVLINEKLSKLSTIHEGLISSSVILKEDSAGGSDNKIAEIKVQIKGNDLFAKKQSKTFEEAVDSSIEALRKQLTRHKDKIQNKR